MALSQIDAVSKINTFQSVGLNLSNLNINSNFSGFQSTNNPMLFMVRFLTVIIGTTLVKQRITTYLGKSIPKLDGTVKGVIKNQNNVVNSSAPLPANHPAITSGVNIDMNSLDRQGKFKPNPAASNQSNLLQNNSSGSVDSSIKSALLTPGATQNYNNLLGLRYNNHTNQMNVSLNSGLAGQSQGNVLSSLLGGLQIFNSTQLITDIIDLLFGCVSTILLSEDQIVQNKMIEAVIQKIQDNPTLGSDNSQSFTLSPTELNAIYVQAKQIKQNVLPFDYGCGYVNLGITLADTAMIANSSDPLGALTNITGDKVFNNTNQAGGSDDSPISVTPNTTNNQAAMQNSLNENFLNQFMMAVMKNSFLSPSTIMYGALVNSVANGITSSITPNNSDPLAMFNSNQEQVTCLVRGVQSQLTTDFYNLMITEVINIISPLITSIIKEKFGNYSNQLLSLVGVSL